FRGRHDFGSRRVQTEHRLDRLVLSGTLQLLHEDVVEFFPAQSFGHVHFSRVRLLRMACSKRRSTADFWKPAHSLATARRRSVHETAALSRSNALTASGSPRLARSGSMRVDRVHDSKIAAST